MMTVVTVNLRSGENRHHRHHRHQNESYDSGMTPCAFSVLALS